MNRWIVVTWRGTFIFNGNEHYRSKEVTAKDVREATKLLTEYFESMLAIGFTLKDKGDVEVRNYGD